MGGDYTTEIQASSDDEVGQFEQLFEQFRRVFIDVLAHVPELQAENSATRSSGAGAGAD